MGANTGNTNILGSQLDSRSSLRVVLTQERINTILKNDSKSTVKVKTTSSGGDVVGDTDGGYF